MNDSATTFVRPILPLKNTVLFPHLVLPLVVGRTPSLQALEEVAASESRRLVLLTQKDASVQEPTLEDLYEVGSEGLVQTLLRNGKQVQVTVLGLERVRLRQLQQSSPYLVGEFEVVPLPGDLSDEVEAQRRVMVELLEAVQELLSSEGGLGTSGRFLQAISQFPEPLEQVFFAAYLLNVGVEVSQQILAAKSRREALKLINSYLQHEVQILKIRKKIAHETVTNLSKEQREYFLRQQLKTIRSELGEESPEQAEIATLRRKLEEATLPPPVAKEARRELSRLERLPLAAPDYQLTRSYLDFICELPWTEEARASLDLQAARAILDAEHYDLEEVKNRLLEFIAVLKLNPESQAPILCLLGPPGVGKTSLGASLARALGRPFDRLSLGGLHDEAELRGHRRTYIGAMPGRILQAIRRAGTRNPLIMLDEIDKLGRDFRGDPAAALMEVLDPAQNKTFKDNYLDLPFDLSHVFFITTANMLDTIPVPLLDRMEVLTMSGYTEAEKVKIATLYLLKRQLSQSGLRPEQLQLGEEVLVQVIRKYTREGGVRELERMLGRLARKAAVQFVEKALTALVIRVEDLPSLLGPERFFLEQVRQTLAVGLAVGMAYTESGGDILYIEAAFAPAFVSPLVSARAELKLTGSLGEIMKESATAALTYVWSQAASLGFEASVLEGKGLHIHIPAGATPKDGPSAGITIATALASLLSGRRVRADIAMSGEITISGQVLPVGGLKEKCLAAKRAGFAHLILPQENAKDLQTFSAEVLAGLELSYVSRVEQALELALLPRGA